MLSISPFRPLAPLHSSVAPPAVPKRRRVLILDPLRHIANCSFDDDCPDFANSCIRIHVRRSQQQQQPKADLQVTEATSTGGVRQPNNLLCPCVPSMFINDDSLARTFIFRQGDDSPMGKMRTKLMEGLRARMGRRPHSITGKYENSNCSGGGGINKKSAVTRWIRRGGKAGPGFNSTSYGKRRLGETGGLIYVGQERSNPKMARFQFALSQSLAFVPAEQIRRKSYQQQRRRSPEKRLTLALPQPSPCKVACETVAAGKTRFDFETHFKHKIRQELAEAMPGRNCGALLEVTGSQKQFGRLLLGGDS